MTSFRNLSNHRIAYEKIWKAYIGSHYGLSVWDGKRTPLNLHAMYGRALVQYLAAHQPKLLISTNVGPWKEWMEEVEYEVSSVMKEEDMGRKQQLFVLSALMYSPGILKVCQDWKRVPTEDGQYILVPGVMIANVDLSDFVYHTGSSTLRDADFVGHKIRRSVEEVLAHPMFEDVEEDWLRSIAGREADTESDRLFFENDDTIEEYNPKVTLFEIHDRTTDQIIVFSPDAPSKHLAEYPWEGHPNGPLFYLDFQDVPNHAIGLSPMCILHDLHEAANRVAAKAISQAELAKTLLVTRGDITNAEAIMESTDGEAVLVDPSASAHMETFGGPDKSVVGILPIIKDLWSYQGGNVDTLAGLGVGAPTASQESQLASMASGMVKFMAWRVEECMTKVGEAIVWYTLQNNVSTTSVPKKLPGGRTIWRKFTPEQREQISAQLLQVTLDVYSMKYRSPEDRKNELMAWWNGVALPGAQIAMAQGLQYDFQTFNRTYAKLTDLEEINDVCIYSMQPQSQLSGSGPMPPPRQSPVTSRTNVRMDRGSSTMQMGGDLAQTAFSGGSE